MFHKGVGMCVCLLILSSALLMAAQQAVPTAANVGVPPLVNFSGALAEVNGKPVTGIVGVTFSLYKDSEGGAPLWMETQNVQLDKTGHYLVMLGSTLSQGLPSHLFASGEARWLGVQAQGQAEQPRVLLVAVPYALKAQDAETIGGKPASAFALAPSAGTSVATNPLKPTATQNISGGGSQSISGGGKPGYIPEWLGTTKLGDSALFQSSAGNLGISTIAPAQKLEIDFGNMLVRGLNNFTKPGDTAHAYVGDSHHAIEAIFASGLAIGAYKVPEAIFIQDKTGNVGIGTTKPKSGILTTVATSPSVLGLSTIGWNAPSGSGGSGSDAFHVAGGNADGSEGGPSGGTAIVANGGIGAGTGVIASGGPGFDPFGNNGGIGLIVTGGDGAVGGAGGRFTGGSTGHYGAGDGIDVSVGGGLQCCADAGHFSGPSDSSLGWAGNFGGDVNVSGAIFAGTKDFKIDHPLDPANKYLLHASVESSEMMNIYAGNVVLDGKGEATIQLPAWFEAVNGDFRYQLTAIGRPSPGLYVEQEISGNRFQIAGGTPGAKVSWQVTGVRHDAYAKANPLLVEKEKTFERGYYIHPEFYGEPEERGIEWIRHPAFMKHVKETRMKQWAARERRQGMPTVTSPSGGTAGSVTP
jgi:hypothetical protein